MNVIVFSKDRACQLDALMRSIQHHVANWDKHKYTVIFLPSAPAFQKGYDIVRAKPYGRYYRMVLQTGKTFKQHVLEAINPKLEHTTFFVDDDVFIRNWDYNDGRVTSLKDPQVAAVSLRMDIRYDYCYTQGCSVDIPTFDKMKWKWIGEQGDWGYPMSLDGHIFRTSEISKLISAVEFTNPNTLESSLASRPPKSSPYMVGYEQAKILNIPINKVQTLNNNKYGQQFAFTVKDLNDHYLQGRSINLDKIYGVDVANAPHYEMDLEIQ